jgi:hypothetical protein
MAIPEQQLETWSHRGSIQQSRDTYATVKASLEDSSSPYSLKTFESFLQGSYANDTNVYRESDVDVVMRLDSTWYHDANLLPREQYEAFERAYPGSANYSLMQFKADVAAWLARKFNGLKVGPKALHIPAGGARRDCDVLVCAHFRYYYAFGGPGNERLEHGICFFLSDGTRVVNFPKQHGDNCTAKHKDTKEWFKPTVRIYKNMRNHLVANKALPAGVAPSYFIEGMLWNVPPDQFGKSYEDTFVATYNFLANADRSAFRCANGIQLLLQNGSQTSWAPQQCEAFLTALRDLWTNWR